MNFEEKIKNFVLRVESLKDKILTEEATKTSIIMPFFQILGYDIFNPNEFIPEFVADVGIKKGEKIDYAIKLDDKISILIEAKSINEGLQKHDSQLFRYFGTSSARLAILTNGIVYNFYTDLDEKNKMDTTPFLQINLLELRENDLVELKKVCKENFNIDSIVNTASDLKYINNIKNILKQEFLNPSDEFTKLILNEGVYDGVKTQSIIDKYRITLKNSISSLINDSVNERLQNALKSSNISEDNTNSENENSESYSPNSEIITTNDELESFYTIKSILSELISPERISYKDTYSYFGVLFDNKVTKWICRVYLKENIKYIIIPDKDKNENRYDIEKIVDIYKFKNELKDRLESLI